MNELDLKTELRIIDEIFRGKLVTGFQFHLF